MAREATMLLSQGREVKLAMPNIYKVITGKATPNPALAAIVRLLDGDGLIEAQGEAQRYQAARENVRGLYEIAALCLVEPVLRLDGDPQAGEIGPADLAFSDLHLIYYSFFRADPLTLSPVPSAGLPREGEGHTPHGNGIQDPAELTIGD
jgi:hypothetical protein